jgi:hypothetical protein
MYGFHFLAVVGSEDRNDRGYYVRILAHAGADLDGGDRYGQPRVMIGETPDPSVEQCLEDRTD